MSDMMTQTCVCQTQGESGPTAEPGRDPSNQGETFMGKGGKMVLRSQNISDLLLLQDVIFTEEGRTLNREEVLARVIGFYNRFVHFKAG